MNAYDILAIAMFAAVAFALWRTFRAEGDGALPGATSASSVIRWSRRKPAAQESLPAEKPAGGEAERLEEKALRLSRLDRGFEAQSFMEYATKAFSDVLAAFEKGDRKGLKPMVSASVYKAFSENIDKMEKRGRKVETEIIRFKRIFIKGIEFSRKLATIDVEFETEQTAIVKNGRGRVIAGDDNQIELVKDAWRFSKNLSERGARWIVSATAAGGSPA